MTPYECAVQHKESVERIMKIYAREVAAKTCQDINAAQSSGELWKLHPYSAQYLLEETIKELQARV